MFAIRYAQTATTHCSVPLGVAALALLATLQSVPAAARDEPSGREVAPAGVAEREPRTMEEITVRGEKSLATLRLELNAARARVYDVFNEINSSDEFDITCRTRARMGSRIPQFECAPRFVSDATRKAVGGFQHTYLSPAMGTRGTMEYLMGMSEVHYKNALLTKEISRLAQESEEFRRAILELERLESQYDDAHRERFAD
jgi:hypothetical protein